MAGPDRLRAHLASHQGEPVALSFDEIETLLGRALPPRAWENASWWENANHAAGEAWTDAGYRAADVDVARGQVTFEEDF